MVDSCKIVGESVIGPQLEELKSVVEAFGKSDTKFILLTKECGELFPDYLIAFITGEYLLHSIASMHGLNIFLHEKNYDVNRNLMFPGEALNKYCLSKQKSTFIAVDWPTVLSKVVNSVEDNSVQVSFTLLCKQYMDQSEFDFYGGKIKTPYLKATGKGLIENIQGKQIQFPWNISYLPWTENVPLFGTKVDSLSSYYKTTFEAFRDTDGKYTWHQELGPFIELETDCADALLEDKGDFSREKLWEAISDDIHKLCGLVSSIDNPTLFSLRCSLLNCLESNLLFLWGFIPPDHEDIAKILEKYTLDQIDQLLIERNRKFYDEIGLMIPEEITIGDGDADFDSRFIEVIERAESTPKLPQAITVPKIKDTVFQEWCEVTDRYERFVSFCRRFFYRDPMRIDTLISIISNHWELGQTIERRIIIPK